MTQNPCGDCHLKSVNDGMLRHVPAPIIRHLPLTVVISLLGIAFVAGTTYLQAGDGAKINARQDLAIHAAEKVQVRIETTVGIIREEQKEVQRDIKSILLELRRQNGSYTGEQ